MVEHDEKEEVDQSNKTDKTAGGSSGGGERQTPSGNYTSQAQQPLLWESAINVIQTRKIDAGLWVTRLMTIFFCFLYLLPVPILGPPVNFYYKAFLSNAATSALRLHQRLPHVSLTRIFFAQLMLEDSCHYLFYSLIFIYCSPITLALVPILLFAVLHFASFSLVLLDALGRNSAWIGRVFISLVEFQTVTILRLAAGAEIFTLIFTVVYTFMGRASLFTPFIYYRFLTMRYASRRNHYTRTMFYELRIQLDHLANSSKCPQPISNIIRKAIDFVSRFAPTVPPPTN